MLFLFSSSHISHISFNWADLVLFLSAKAAK